MTHPQCYFETSLFFAGIGVFSLLIILTSGVGVFSLLIIFTSITEARLTLNQILSDKMDYKTLALKTEDKEERIALYNKHLLKVSCANLLSECRNAWKMIIGK